MNTATKLGGFAVAAVVVFAGAYGVGQAAGPVGSTPKPMHAEPGGEPMGPMHGEAGKTVERPPAGLQVSVSGYTVQAISTDAVAGRPLEYAFRILGHAGTPVTAFRTRHDKLMHLIVVRRDLSDYRHLHPVMSPDGTWRVPLTFTSAGTYRAFADFAVDGGPSELTLGLDVPVAGDYRPAPLPPAAPTAVVDGYTVTVDGDLTPGKTSTLIFTVSLDGRPVTDLEPYLGAAGHLVVLRAGDLAYLHVHADGDGLAFTAEVPTTGAYRMFLDFQHHGQVHTAELTAEVR